MDRDCKLIELILYIARQWECDATYGAIRLNKGLFYSDLIAYVNLGRTITGQEYQKLKQGPAPRRLVPVQKRMQKAGECAVQTRQYFGRPQNRLIALRDPDLSSFTGEEIAIVDTVLGHFQGRTAREVSELSHRFVGWETVEDGETIPFACVFVSDEPLTEEEKAFGATLEPSVAQET